MQFIKFPSIENMYRTKFVNHIHKYGFTNGEWICTEKIHGCNLSLHVCGEEFDIGSRNQFLNGANHCGTIHYVEYLEDIAKNLYSVLGLKDEQMVIFGEWYGGFYPHSEVERVDNATRVQKEVLYSPSNHFSAFSLVVVNKENKKWYDYHTRTKLFKEAGVPYCKPLCIGTFQECIDYPNEFETTIPKEFGLPSIEGNICEGVVIEPVIVRFFPTGSRVVLKNKNEKHSEKSKVKKHAQKDWKEEFKFGEEGERKFNEAVKYVTENRLRNVLSHIGEVTNKDFGKVMGLFIKDVMEEFSKECGEDFDDEKMTEKEHKMFGKLIGGECQKILRQNFANIIDGEF
jgi:Rnl2 family RNA ligase